MKYPGNKERAGWKFLALEFKPKEQNKNNYGEFYSWQERCISCHTTGFDPKAWSAAKADFVAGKRKDLKDLFVADHLISCEACHGPGSVHAKAPSKGNIINPTKITNVEARKMVCEWGMSDLMGPVSLGKKDESIFLGRDMAMHKNFSEETAVKIDEEIKRIVDESYTRAITILRENAAVYTTAPAWASVEIR